MTNDSSYGQAVLLPWRQRKKAPGAMRPVARATLTDIHPASLADPTAAGFVLSLLAGTTGPILWAQDHMSRRENGQLYTPHLQAIGITNPIVQVHVGAPHDVLRAMEEGAACSALSAVIGEIHGAPPVLDFTATKRLALRAEAAGVPVFLIRSGDPGALSAARERWRVGALPSQPHPDDSQAPGAPQWDMHLFRAQGRAPGRWVARYDPNAGRPADRLGLVSRPDDGPLDAGDQPIPDRAGG